MSKTFYDLIPSAPAGRFDDVERNYTVEEVEKLRGSFPVRKSSRLNSSPLSISFFVFFFNN